MSRDRVDLSFWATSGQSWPALVEGCQWAEADGWHGIWVPDHFMGSTTGFARSADGPAPEVDPELAPMLEAWTMLGALAVLVPRVRLGVMVSGTTYRHPAVLAKMAATVDHISEGRVVLGIGAGWQENEHRRYGLDLGDPATRSDRLEEACAIVSGLLREPRTDFSGRFHQLEGAPCEPKPIGPMPLLVGGGGEQRTLRTTARWADEWNVWGRPADIAHKLEVLRRHCEEIGRDPATIRITASALLVICDDESRAAELGAEHGHRSGLVGTVDQLRERVAAYTEIGVDELVIPDFNISRAERNDLLGRFRTDVVDKS